MLCSDGAVSNQLPTAECLKKGEMCTSSQGSDKLKMIPGTRGSYMHAVKVECQKLSKLDVPTASTNEGKFYCKLT